MGILGELGMITGLAKRFVAGTTLKQALKAVQALNKNGMLVTLDALGENVKSLKEANEAVKTYSEILEAIHKHKLQSGISVKLTMLGLDLGDKMALVNMEKVMKVAKKHNIFVRIDMEGSVYTQRTLNIFYKLKKRYPNLGIVLQAMLRRTEKDVAKVAKTKAPVRLVKGAYLEPAKRAYPEKEAVNEHYKKDLIKLLQSRSHVAIATHDTAILAFAKDFIEQKKIPKSRYEFQMLYGIRRDLQKKLVAEGYPMRVYVPYGKNYIPYFTRRLRERKENVYFLLKNLFK